jgi:predicted DNA-binding transcriptional regulator AlpA
MDTLHPSQILNYSKAAQLAGLSIRTLQRLCREGSGPKRTQLSRRRVGIRISDLLAWLESRATQAD